MTKIHELKQPETASDKPIIDHMQWAMKTCRENEITGVAVVMTRADGHFFSRHQFAKDGGNSSVLMSCLDYERQDILNRWMKKNGDGN